eukprot:scaffold5143_cov231-Pinguiococcus_pyrenoidosus.AAC.1
MISGGPHEGRNAMGQVSEVIPVPVDKVGKLIGRGGATISQLQQTFSCRIQIPQEPDPQNPSQKSVHITSNAKEQIDLLRDEITRIISNDAPVGAGQGYGGAPAPGTINMTYDIPDERVGAVIGKRGATIQYIQNTTQTRIQIPNDADVGSNPKVRHAVISGLPQNCEHAKREIENILANDGRIPNTHSGGDAYGPGGGGSAYGQYGSYEAANPYADPMNPNAYMYAAYNPYAIAAAAAVSQQQAAAGAQDAASVDPSYYHQQFWQYAAYYGEEYARAAYGAWAPPVGTPCPPGITLPTQSAATGAAPAASAAPGAPGADPAHPAAAAATAAADPATAAAAAAAAAGAAAAAPAAPQDATSHAPPDTAGAQAPPAPVAAET